MEDKVEKQTVTAPEEIKHEEPKKEEPTKTEK